jgi:hypothetical protein
MKIKIPFVFVWIGLVCAISFIEAWLKFTAPGVTLTIGLAIGQVVFNALNKVELVMAFTIGVLIMMEKPKAILENALFILATLILLIQTFYVLPVLSARIDSYLSGNTPPASNLHGIYVLQEIIKVLALVIYGLYELNKLNK